MEAQLLTEVARGIGGGATGDPGVRAQRVAQIAAQHAVEVDSAARFPHEAAAALKAERLLGILVPKSLGGEGLVTTARRAADAAPSDQVLIAFLKSDYTLTRLQGWDALGMRGTCSEGYTLKAQGDAGQILPEPYEVIHSRTMVPFAHLLWGSVWAGIAAGATQRAQAFIRNAMRHGNGQLPPGAPQFTKALTTLRTLRSMLATSLRSYENCMHDPKALAALDFQTLITLTKVEASELAAATVMSAMRACGLSGYRNDGDYTIGRYLRDVLSSPIMINNDRILANLAPSALVSPIPRFLRE